MLNLWKRNELIALGLFSLWAVFMVNDLRGPFCPSETDITLTLLHHTACLVYNNREALECKSMLRISPRELQSLDTRQAATHYPGLCVGASGWPSECEIHTVVSAQ